MPSLYCGTLVFLFAFSQFQLRWFRTRAADHTNQVLSWLLVLSLVGSFGWYGLGWFLFPSLINSIEISDALSDRFIDSKIPFMMGSFILIVGFFLLVVSVYLYKVGGDAERKT